MTWRYPRRPDGNAEINSGRRGYPGLCHADLAGWRSTMSGRNPMRLRRADPNRPGYGRRGHGRGFAYVDAAGHRLKADEVERIRALVIPPAWKDVWISPDPRGHIQATGVDAAGRKQYLYHPQWRVKRDAAKFDHVLEAAQRLPALRKRVDGDLSGRGLGGGAGARRRGAAARHGHVPGRWRPVRPTVSRTRRSASPRCAPTTSAGPGAACVLEFPAKGGIDVARQVEDPDVCAVLRDLRRRRRRPGAPVRLLGRPVLARRARRRRQRLPARGQRRRDDREGLPHLARHRGGGDGARRGGPAPVGEQAQAGGGGRDAVGGRAAGQHADRGPRRPMWIPGSSTSTTTGWWRRCRRTRRATAPSGPCSRCSARPAKPGPRPRRRPARRARPRYRRRSP